MLNVLVAGGWTFLDGMSLVLFMLLLTQLVFGFTIAATGFWVLWRGEDRIRINNTLPPDDATPGALSATAIIVPICNEDVSRVFQGLLVMFESLQQTGRGEDFDFFILSDSNDPNYWIAEENAWLELCKRVQGFGRIFYRKRRTPLHCKSGNVADFCRRWGAKYRYMIVLDADSVMTGETFVRLVRLMEKNPRVGIIQTNPQTVLGKSLFQRIMQFMGRVQRPMFSAGLNFWQLGSGNFWGHNAILRVRPFIEHCAMPKLPAVKKPASHILSHDTLEAALMRSAGYTVWFAYDLGGSFEEGPPHLLESLRRDRRWCFGNMQHLPFLFMRGLKPASRFHMLNGVMNYASSPLWLAFLVLSTVTILFGAQQATTPFPGFMAAVLQSSLSFVYVMTLLLLPKILGMTLILRSGEKVSSFGGRRRIVLSTFLEICFSILVAPILMLFYTRFIFAFFTGGKIKWNQQKRDTGLPSARELISAHGGNTLFVLAWIALLAFVSLRVLPGMMLIFLGPLLSIPFSFFTASIRLAEWAGKQGLFLIPEETQPPLELQRVQEPFIVPTHPFFLTDDYATDYGLLQAVLDPYINATHVSLLRQRRWVNRETRKRLFALRERLLRDGPATLSAREKRVLLWDANSMTAVHLSLWSRPTQQLHEWWQAALHRYNESVALFTRRASVCP